ncbi:MAG: hypothetical protein NVS4B8_24970 [Herpetosiphon sp.]
MIEANRLLGEAYLHANQPHQALAAFEHVLRIDPENIAAYYGLGLAHQSLEERPDAIRCFERALEIQPNLNELRAQLMRLYAETPGAPGQFRLSRSGLGRLYARGQMYTQAIDEFRAVLDAEPDRDDVRVALADVLWRDGHEDDAADWCRESLDYQPDLHKPALILGYLQLAGGQSEGEVLWQRAVQQDPQMSIARTLFDILPPMPAPMVELPAFDLEAWRRELYRQQAEASAPPTPVEEPATVSRGAESWLDEPQHAGIVHTEHAASSPTASHDDDLLASLLGLGEEAPSAAAETTSIAHNDVPPVQHNLAVVADQPRHPSDDMGALKPFSFDDWNLDEEAPATPPPPVASSEPFTMADFPQGTVAPFSLDEADFATPAAIDHSRPEQHFSLEDDFGDAGIPPWTVQDDELGTQPFLLQDEPEQEPFAFDASEHHSVTSAADVHNEQHLHNQLSAEEDATAMDFDGIAPFSFEGLDNDQLGDDPHSDPDSFKLDDFPVSDLDTSPAFEPFSSEESGSDVPHPGGHGASERQPDSSAVFEDEGQGGGFSWQQPAWRQQNPAPAPSGTYDENESIFAKLMKNQPPTTHDAVERGLGDGGEPQFFSMDNVELRDALTGPYGAEHGASTAEPGASHTGLAASSSQWQPDEPFDDDTTRTSPAAGHPSAGTDSSHQRPSVDRSLDAEPFSFVDFDPPAEMTDVVEKHHANDEWPGSGISDESDLLPFSLAELGIDEQDLTELEHPVADATPHAPDHGNVAQHPASAENAAMPFSLADLGLGEDDFADLARPDSADSALNHPSSSRGAHEPTSNVASAFEDIGLPPFSSNEGSIHADPPSDELTNWFEEPHSAPAVNTSSAHEAADRPALQTPPATTQSDRSVHESPFDFASESFSLHDLGLTDAEIDHFDLGTSPLPVPYETTEQAHGHAAEATEHAAVLPDPASHAPEETPRPAESSVSQNASFMPAAPAFDVHQSTGAGLSLQPSHVPLGGTTDAPSAGAGLHTYVDMLASNPDDDTMRLAVARMAEQVGDIDQAMEQYKQLIRRNAQVDTVVEDLLELTASQTDGTLLRRLHRLLGDAYIKQNRFREAMSEYSWTLTRNS